MPERHPWNQEKWPNWVRKQDAESQWREWIETKVSNCDRRAKAWARDRGNTPVPTRNQWAKAIWKSLLDSKGFGYYSKFPLSLLEKENTHWSWPSVDHVSSLDETKVVIEVRLVNDMKTIMTQQEFRDMIGHLACTGKIKIKKVKNNWSCKRSFKGSEKPTQEPPLPSC